MDYRKQRIEDLSDSELERDELLRRRLVDPDVKKTFRNAYVFKVGWDYKTLYPYCENIVQATDGSADHVDRARAKLALAMKDYDSDKDVIVIVGRAFDNLLVGTIVTANVLQKPKARQSFAVAIYYNFHYRFYQIYLDPTIESYEIAQKNN